MYEQRSRKIIYERFPDLVKYLVINDLETIPNQNISVTARTTELYKKHLFPDCKTHKEFIKQISNKSILDVGSDIILFMTRV